MAATRTPGCVSQIRLLVPATRNPKLCSQISSNRSPRPAPPEEKEEEERRPKRKKEETDKRDTNATREINHTSNTAVLCLGTLDVLWRVLFYREPHRGVRIYKGIPIHRGIPT